MAIRFCKGEKADLELQRGVLISPTLFEEIHAVLIETNDEYVPVYSREGQYLFCAYEDKGFNETSLRIWNMLSRRNIVDDYEACKYTIVSCNEVAYYLYKLLLFNGFDVFVKGEIWKEILPKAKTTDIIIGTPIFSEGNPGLKLSELGYWKAPIPYNEFSLVEKMHQSMSNNGGLYKKKWLSKNECNRMIGDLIRSGEPAMIARLGNTEAMIVQEYSFRAYSRLWTEWLYTTSGFFSESSKSIKDLDRYAEMTIKAIQKCDVHCCRFDSQIGAINTYADEDSKLADWYDLYTQFDRDNCWLSSLAGKRVLVISSACKTIKHQYENSRRELFEYADLLPEMTLSFYQTVETQLGKKQGYKSWFEAYEKMIDDIRRLEFDIALVSAGAYGYPLAADIKDMKKTVIELCSGIYPLFGIKVKAQQTIRKVSSMYNPYWVFPMEIAPENYMKIEKGCYWE